MERRPLTFQEHQKLTDRIQKERAEQGLSISDLADMTGYSVRSIYRLLDPIQSVSWDLAYEVLRVLDIKWEDL